MLTRRSLGLLAALAPLAASAQPASPATPYFAERGLALRGYDPVAYFSQGRPVAGRAEFSHPWQGATWRFASAANRDAFAADPERYAPQFGGFCAWAVSQGYSAPIDPQAWKIVEGKLYLNYDRSVQRRWEGDIPGNVARGEANWPRVSAGLAAPR